MGKTAMIPAPPPGFDTDVTPSQSAGGNVPPPPPGFDQEVTPNTDSGYQSPEYSPGGLIGNAFREVGGVGKSIFNNAKDIPQLAQDVYQTGKQLPSILSGKTSVMDTPMGGRMLDSAANAMPVAENMKTSIEHPIDFAYTHPVTAGMALYGGIKGARSIFSAAPAELASERGAVTLGGEDAAKPTPPIQPTSPNYLEKMGGSNLNSTLGIREQTLRALTPYGVNPEDAGIDLAQKLEKAGVPLDAGRAWNKLYKPGMLRDQAGAAVGAAHDEIANEAAKYGAVQNPTQIEATQALKPLYDGWAERADRITKIGRSYAEPFEDAYTGLSKTAQKNGGFLTLDDIDKVMKEVGPLTHRGAPEAQEAMSDLFHSLADTRDNVVQAVADQANNPSLKTNLLEANKQYSFLQRLEPDISRKARMGSIGQKTLAGIGEDIKNSVVSRGASYIGNKIVKGTAPALKGGSVPLFSKGAFTTAEGEMPNPAFGEPKTLTPQLAKDFLKRAGGDKDQARKMAADEGYSF